MKLKLLPVLIAAAIAAWCPASFAQQQSVVGSGTLNATGVTGGVAMTGQGGGGTLTVGTVGGPQMNIFTNNSAGGVVTNSALVAVSTDVSSLSNIVFNSSSTVFGAIGVTQPGGPFFLNLSGGNAGTTVNFEGNVFATTLNVTGTGTVNFNSGSTNTTATNFAADGTISLAPNTTVIGALTTTAGANTGTLSLGSGSTLNGAVGGGAALKTINVVGGNNTAGVTATITGAVNSNAFSLGTNTLNIGGALTIGAGGVINTTLASPTVFGNIRPVGATNLPPALGINVTVPSTAVIPVGTLFNIVQTQTGTLQSGTNGSVVTPAVVSPTNPLYSFSAVPAAGTVAGLVTIRTDSIPLLVPIVAPPVGSPVLPIAIPVVTPLVTLLPVLPPTSTILPVVAAIDALTNPLAVVNAVAQLAPSAPDLAAPLATFLGIRQFQNLWLSRLDALRCGEISQPYDPTIPPEQRAPTCQETDLHSGWWAKGFGYVGSQGAQQAFVGSDAAIHGTMIGYDTAVAPETHAGLGFGYARSQIDGRRFAADTGSNTYQGTAYVTHEHGPWYLQGDVSFGEHDFSGSRNISFPGINLTPHANYSGQSYTSFMTTGYHFFNQGFTITPLASLQYTHLNLDNYTESGAGDVGLRVNSQSYNFLESGLGVKVARPLRYGDGTYVPEIHFKWLRELDNPTLVNTASFLAAGSPSFTTPGLKTSEDTLNLGVGIQFLSCGCTAGTWSFEAVYDHDWGSRRYSADQGMIRFTTRF